MSVRAREIASLSIETDQDLLLAPRPREAVGEMKVSCLLHRWKIRKRSRNQHQAPMLDEMMPREQIGATTSTPQIRGADHETGTTAQSLLTQIDISAGINGLIEVTGQETIGVAIDDVKTAVTNEIARIEMIGTTVTRTGKRIAVEDLARRTRIKNAVIGIMTRGQNASGIGSIRQGMTPLRLPAVIKSEQKTTCLIKQIVRNARLKTLVQTWQPRLAGPRYQRLLQACLMGASPQCKTTQNRHGVLRSCLLPRAV